MDLERARAKLRQLGSVLDQATSREQEEKRTLAESRARLKATQEAQELAQAVAQRVQTDAHRKIADIVTRCLAIFDEPYEFRIHFDRKRGKTEARMVLHRDGAEVDPLDASGGGVVDVASFALRLACVVLRKPPLRRLLVLDEPAKHLSSKYRPAFREVLEKIAAELGVQVLMVTHDRRLEAGRVVRLGD